MSQDLLSLVKPPIETVKQAPPFPKPAEKPAEDFLAVLDRAISGKAPQSEVSAADAAPVKPDERSPEQSRPVEADTTRPRNDPTQSEARDIGRDRNEMAVVAQANNEARTLASARLEKSHGRQDARPTVQNIPKADTKPHLTVVRTADPKQQTAGNENLTRETMAQALSAQGLIQRSVVAAADKNQPATDDGKANSPTSRKVNHKTNQTDSSERITSDRKKLAASKDEAATKGVDNQKTSRLGKLSDSEAAAAKMQLHADTGGTKGLADALSVVKNLADKLGLGSGPAEAAQAVSKTIDLSRNPMGLGLVKTNQVSQHGESTEKTVANKNSRVEILRAERLGRRDGSESLQQAADKGRVQVVDRSQPGNASLVLESMLAERSKNGQSGRSEDGSRKDSLQLINTAFLNPVNERNVVSIPVHLVASQNGNLAQALRSHLSDKGNSDIVQQARIIMDGKESGEIKLILKPENLGEVRIHLQMNDGHIAGQIFVENKEVQAAFQDNLESLMQAFQEGGLTMGSMQVNVQQQNQGQQGQQDLADERSAERHKLHAVRSLENSVATVSMAESAYSQVNLVV